MQFKKLLEKSSNFYLLVALLSIIIIPLALSGCVGSISSTPSSRTTSFTTSSSSEATYSETVLHSFGGPVRHAATKGIEHYSGLTEYDGNFYGTTSLGGAYNAGAVFEIKPSEAEHSLILY